MGKTVELIIEIDGQKHNIQCNPGESILDAALRNGVDAPYACLAGTCTSCQAHLNEGKVHMDVSDALTQDEVNKGEVLTCQARPLTDKVSVTFPDM